MEAKLRPYQSEVFAQLSETPADTLIEFPTGAGKTLLVIAIIAKLLQTRKVSHAVIAAPQLQIESGFFNHGLNTIRAGDELLELNSSLLTNAKRYKAKQLIEYLAEEYPETALTLTHQTLAGISANDLADDLVGSILVIDEAHHVPSTKLGDFVDAWREKGGIVYYTTATPYRSDWEPVQIEGMRCIRRSLAEHMQDGDGAFAPKALESELVGIDVNAKVSAAQYNGEQAPPAECHQRLVQSIVEKWEEEGRPKSIVKIPTLSGGTKKLVKLVCDTFQKNGVKVLDATGTGKGRQKEILDALDKDRDLPYDEAFDVVVGINRVKEGTDWAHCSHVFVIGFPKSLQAVIQLIGRATRKKPDNYPERHRDLAKIVFFVLASGKTLESLNLDHSRHALFVSTFLADAQTGQRWLLEREFRRGITSVLADKEFPDFEPAPHAAKSLISMIVVELFDEVGDKDLELGEICDHIRKNSLFLEMDPDEREVAITQVVGEFFAMQEGNRRKLGQRIRKKTKAGLKDTSINKILAELITEFRTETISASVTQELRGQLHRLTGGKMREFAQRLADAASLPITIEEVRAEILAYFEMEGKWPSSQPVFIQRFGCSWSVLNQNLTEGYRSLPGGSSVAAEVREVQRLNGYEESIEGGITIEMIEESMERYYHEHNRLPTMEKNDKAPGLGIRWRSVESNLRHKGRGLDTSVTIGEIRNRVRKRLGLSLLGHRFSIEEVRTALKAFNERTGKWPTVSSGEIPELGIKAKTLNTRLSSGKVGLPGGSSLAKEIQKLRDGE